MAPGLASMMNVSRIWIRLSWPASVLMALASAAGVLAPAVYAKETSSWGAQAVGQDITNLALVFPVLLLSTWYVRGGSVRALTLWLGALIYVVYSYLMYAFFVHFGPMFLVHVAALGLSAYTLVGASASLDLESLRRHWPPAFRLWSVAAFLVFIGVGFAFVWLSAIARALVAGTAPEGIAEIGMPVNPVHVLDLAFLLPLAVVTGVAHWRRRAFGLLFAPALLVFFILMGVAIISMTFVMHARGVSSSLAPVPIMGGSVLISVLLLILALRWCDRQTTRDRVAGSRKSMQEYQPPSLPSARRSRLLVTRIGPAVKSRTNGEFLR
jgi:hypothetical protein